MLVDLTKQLAQQALTSAMTPDPVAPPAPATGDNAGAVIINQIGAMQKALKDDEELVLHVESAGEKIRVMEIFLPSPQVVLSGIDPNRVGARVVSAVSALQLLVRTTKAPAGVKPVRINLVMPRTGK